MDTATSNTLSTVHPYRPARLTVPRVIKLMRAGATLHCTYSPTTWALSNGWEVGAPVANKVVQHPDIAGVGDCLFRAELSQTWRFVGR